MSKTTDHSQSVRFDASRAAGNDRLVAFTPEMGASYAQLRNFDYGPEQRYNVSCLSPWVRMRLLTEDELARAALAEHGYEASEKFQQEICWRTYFKGWLEHRPQVWTAYQQQLTEELDHLERNSGVRSAYEAAICGQTGIAGFDDWARELVATGYLHNHARMWFASIWMFTLRLPWTLGADFFLRHLMDGDAASNTLSWRWVGGLHTPGKTYLASRSNIEKFTDGRFSPSGLAAEVVPIEGMTNPVAGPLTTGDELKPVPSVLLLAEDDLGFETLIPENLEIAGICGLAAPEARSPLGYGEIAGEFVRRGVTDALRWAEARFAVPSVQLEARSCGEEIVDFARECGARQIVTGFCPTGWTQAIVNEMRTALEPAGIHLVQIQRRWDQLFWPHAQKGFFQLKKQIPHLYETLGFM